MIERCVCICAVDAISFSFAGLSVSPCAIPITPLGVGIFPAGVNIQPIGAYIVPEGVNVQPQVSDCRPSNPSFSWHPVVICEGVAAIHPLLWLLRQFRT